MALHHLSVLHEILTPNVAAFFCEDNFFYIAYFVISIYI